MLLSDNISCIFQVPTIKTLNSLEEVKDPSFTFDVKLHFRQRPDHWKEVQAPGIHPFYYLQYPYKRSLAGLLFPDKLDIGS
jgi:hypothetical protein